MDMLTLRIPLCLVVLFMLQDFIQSQQSMFSDLGYGECLKSSNGAEYAGKRSWSFAEPTLQCRLWTEWKVENYKFIPDDRSAIKAQNYCRFIERTDDEPWCYTTPYNESNPKPTYHFFVNCNIPKCSAKICYGSPKSDCHCNDGYQEQSPGSMNCIDRNECVTHTGCHGCVNTEGGYTCKCKQGFHAFKGPTNTLGNDCFDIDECNTTNHDCDQICHNTPGSYYCRCKDGFVSSGYNNRTCTDIDECNANNGGCAHKCNNILGSYECSCNHGYLLSDDRHSCLDEDECTSTPNTCEQLCNNTIGSFHCHCNVGYVIDESNTNKCADIDECRVNNQTCQQHTCGNTDGSYLCHCLCGFHNEIGDNHKCIEDYIISASPFIACNIVFLICLIASIAVNTVQWIRSKRFTNKQHESSQEKHPQVKHQQQKHPKEKHQQTNAGQPSEEINANSDPIYVMVNEEDTAPKDYENIVSAQYESLNERTKVNIPNVVYEPLNV